MAKKRKAEPVNAINVAATEVDNSCAYCGSRRIQHGACIGCGMPHTRANRRRHVVDTVARCSKCNGVLRSNAFNDSGACDDCGHIQPCDPREKQHTAIGAVEREIRVENGTRRTGERKRFA